MGEGLFKPVCFTQDFVGEITTTGPNRPINLDNIFFTGPEPKDFLNPVQAFPLSEEQSY